MNTSISALLERKPTGVHAVHPDIPVFEAVAEMNRHRVGSILVMENGHLAGIFTERDVLKRVVGAGLDPRTTQVRAVMTSNVITVTPETTVTEVMDIFSTKRCRHLPVISHDELAGLISIGDVSRYMADVHRTECEHLKSYIAGGFPA
ncbi:MAG TPA: CBS domain-containing protein [Opitutaceae bacterium]|jgi:CBS domain-containing protein|nr:CBS domain-containing protein [Opitutaceae bacterium]